MPLTTRYFAAARAVTGVSEDEVTFPDQGTLGLLVAVLSEQYGPELGRLLERCSFFVDGSLVRDRAACLRDGSTVDVLPPFAGG